MDTQMLSTDATTMGGAFIAQTTADVASRRGEEILGFPIVKDKVWNVTTTVSPSEAKMILLAMPAQRPLQSGNVAYFRSLIQSGRFKVTHQGIAFDKAGRLIDGQHRLTACVEADAAIEIQVTFNLDGSLFDSFDRGKNRTIADDLITSALTATKIDGFLVSAGAKILWHLDAGRAPWTSLNRGEFDVNIIRDVMQRHPYIHDAAALCGKNSAALRGIGTGVMTAFYTKFHEAHAGKAEQFMEQLIWGENLRGGDPVYALREYRKFAGSAMQKTNRAAIMVILVRCWNAFVEGRQLSKVSSALRGDENFPKISKGK